MRRSIFEYFVAAALLAGCAPTSMGPREIPPARAYKWIKVEDVRQSTITKIETDMAGDFCSALFSTASTACAVRLEGMGRCIIVIEPNAGAQAAHEAGGHCMGYDHR